MTFTPRIQRAIDLAAHCHRDHKRIGPGLPYIVHPFSVAMIAAEYTTDEDVFCAALLHDAVEDSNECDNSLIEHQFGERVAAFVRSVTEKKHSGRTLEMLRQNWEQRKHGYLEGLSKAPQEALIICAADSIHNLESLVRLKQEHGDAFSGAFGASMDKKMGFYGRVLEKLKKISHSPITSRLESAYEVACGILL